MTIAIIGNPNTGKSTLFNVLSGGNAHIGNFPGVTVEKKVGSVTWEGRQIDLVDLPGTYSLAPRSIDEMLAVDILLGRQKRRSLTRCHYLYCGCIQSGTKPLPVQSGS